MMTTFFAKYIDFAVLGLCFVFTAIHTVRMVRQATVPLRKLPAVLVIFGATANAMFMGAGHLFENSYHAVERVIAGTFVFDFRMYSLFLMGSVLLALSVYTLRQIRFWFQGIPGSQRNILLGLFLIVVVSAPTTVFTPIGMFPSIACGISLVGLPFVMKRPVVVAEPIVV